MNILFLDTAASSGGALSILKQFYIDNSKKSNDNIFFIVSTDAVKSCENITVERVSWTKKSWIHRIIFDVFYLRKYIKKWNIDRIVSLQNILPPGKAKEKFVYVHNILPLYKGILKAEGNKTLWIYLNIISPLIIRSMKKADKVIVQRNWIKESFSKTFKISKDKIVVKSPKTEINITGSYSGSDECVFCYPTNAMPYKNIKNIIIACKKLKDDNINNYSFKLTLKGNETKAVKSIKDYCERENLPVCFIGKLKTNDLFDLYKKSVLVFPSLLETVGLPLLEAKTCGAPILAADREYSHETIGQYDNVEYFDPLNADSLYNLMKVKILKNS